MNFHKLAVRMEKALHALPSMWLALVLGLLLSSKPASAQTYSLLQIEPPEALGTNGFSAVLNDHGELAGSGSGKAFFWRNGQSILLPLPMDHEASAIKGLSENGTVFADIKKPGEPARAVIWIRNQDGTFGLPTELNALLNEHFYESGVYTYRGSMTADARFLTGSTEPFQTGGVLLELDPANRTVLSIAVLQEFLQSPGPAWSHDSAIIDGELAMTGFIRHPNPTPEYPFAGIDRAFRYYKGAYIELYSVGSSASHGESMNSSLQVCGRLVRSGQYRPAYWDEAGKLTDIFAGRYLMEGWASSINNIGQVVGWANVGTLDAAKHRGFIWHPMTGLQWLTALLSPVDSADVGEVENVGSINSSGQILVRARKRDGRQVTALMIPQSHPSVAITTTDGALRLSWPEWANRFFLESAPSLKGPWERTAITGAILDGNVVVTAEPQGNQQFFRLRN